MTNDELMDNLLDCWAAVSEHRSTMYQAYQWKDMEQMVAAMDLANERLWDAVLRKGHR